MKKQYFSVSVSKEGYAEKVFAESCVMGEEVARKWGMHKTMFREVDITVDDFVGLVTTGHTFCGLFRHKGDNFDASQKNGEKYMGSQLVFIDIDETQYETMQDFIDKLSYPPTVGYYSFSDIDKVGSRHFRLVYVLDRIYDREEITLIYYTLATQIIFDTDEKIKDNCGAVVEQCMFGTCFPDVYVNRDAVYNIEDVELEGCEEEYEKVQQKAQERAKSLICRDVPTPDKHFIYEMKLLPCEQFVGKYYGMGYRNIFHTQYDDYEQVEWGWYADTTENHLKLFYNCEQMHDGEKRRKTLFKRMCLRILMKPDITIEELIYCAYLDREQFIDNSDGVVDNDCLIRNAKNAFRLSPEAIRIKYKRSVDWCKAHRSAFVIADDVPEKRRLVPKVRKHRKDCQIGSIYDTSKSFTDNLADITANGMDIKERRLKKWCEENGIIVPRKVSERQKAAQERNEKLIEQYDLALTGKENAEALGISTAMAHRIKQMKLHA